MKIMKNASPVSFSDLDGFAAAYHSKRYYAAMTHSVSKASVADAAFCPENAYRMRFTLTDEGGSSASYRALFVKRDDGSCYLYALDALA